MKASWDTFDQRDWDAAHSQIAGALQQDWAYGSTMRLLGVPVLRACVEQDGAPVALAQFIVRRFGPVASVSLCSRGPLWLAALDASDKARAHRALRASLPLRGLRFLLLTLKLNQPPSWVPVKCLPLVGPSTRLANTCAMFVCPGR